MFNTTVPKLSENRILHYFEKARKISFNSDNTKAKVGSIIVYKNKIISIGWNFENKTNPVQEEYNKLRNYKVDVKSTKSALHAEFSAMLKIKYMDIDFSKINMFVYREKKDGTIGYARPCEACMGLAKKLGIKNIYYTTNDGWCYERIK